MGELTRRSLCGGMRPPVPARVPGDIAAMDETTAKVLAAEQREEITYLRQVLRAPWWLHAAAAARTAGQRALQALASYRQHRR